MKFTLAALVASLLATPGNVHYTPRPVDQNDEYSYNRNSDWKGLTAHINKYSQDIQDLENHPEKESMLKPFVSIWNSISNERQDDLKGHYLWCISQIYQIKELENRHQINDLSFQVQRLNLKFKFEDEDCSNFILAQGEEIE